MKKLLAIVLLLICGLTSFPVQAAPERIPVKQAQKGAKEKAAVAALKNMDLQDIEDPAARNAIKEILNYLNLASKK